MHYSETVGDYTLETDDLVNFTITKRIHAFCGRVEYTGDVDSDGEILGYYCYFDAKGGTKPVAVTPPPFARLVAHELAGKIKARARTEKAKKPAREFAEEPA